MLLNLEVLEKTPEGPLDCKEIQPVHSEGDQPRDFFIDIFPGNLDSSLCFIQPSVSHGVLCTEVK